MANFLYAFFSWSSVASRSTPKICETGGPAGSYGTPAAAAEAAAPAPPLCAAP